jgi:hypothetical protein
VGVRVPPFAPNFLQQIPRLRSGFRQQAPASLTPAERLNLGSGAVRRGGSSPPFRTNSLQKNLFLVLFGCAWICAYLRIFPCREPVDIVLNRTEQKPARLHRLGMDIRLSNRHGTVPRDLRQRDQVNTRLCQLSQGCMTEHITLQECTCFPFSLLEGNGSMKKPVAFTFVTSHAQALAVGWLTLFRSKTCAI